VQITNRRRVHVVGYRIKRGAGQIEIHGVKRLVEENGRIAFEIMKARFAGEQIADRRRFPVLSIFTTWVVAKLQPNEERIFAWNGFAPCTIGMIGLYFRGGDNRLSQYARYDQRCARCLQTLCECQSPKLGNAYMAQGQTALTPARP
jgi:hypothetical protein